MDFGANAGVQRPEWLVEQQHFRLHDERLRQRQALLHATGKLCRVFILGAGKADFADQPPRLVDRAAASGAEKLCLAARRRKFAAEQHIAEDGQMREDGVALENHAAIRPRLERQRFTVKPDGAPCRSFLAEEHAQECRLATAGRADKGDESA